MSEYIERDKVAASLSACETQMNRLGIFVCQFIKATINDIPAADVRPVVLCRDCQHWDTDWIPNHARGNEHFCPCIGLTTREDWFCSRGEKREES